MVKQLFRTSRTAKHNKNNDDTAHRHTRNGNAISTTIKLNGGGIFIRRTDNSNRNIGNSNNSINKHKNHYIKSQFTLLNTHRLENRDENNNNDHKDDNNKNINNDHKTTTHNIIRDRRTCI